MKLKDVNTGLIGKKVEISVTGLIVKGIIKGIFENEYSKGIEVSHEPIQWGNQILTNTISTARKFDEFGNLRYAKLI